MKLLHIGRALDNEIVIEDASISRKHAQLFIDDTGSVFVIDLNSTNGTFVNGMRINSRVRLNETDILKLGSKIVSWQTLVDKAGGAVAGGSLADGSVAGEAPAEVDLDPEPEPVDDAKRKSRRQTLIIGGLAAVTLLLVLAMVFSDTLFGGGSSGGNLAGRWVEKENAKAWIDFKEDGSYQEGYDQEVIFTPATWETHGSNGVLIKHDGITVFYTYDLKSSELTIQRTDQEDVYTKAGA